MKVGQLDDLGRTAEHIDDLFNNGNPREVIVRDLCRANANTLVRAIDARYPEAYDVRTSVEVKQARDVYTLSIRRKE